MGIPIRPYLELIRVFLTPTALADSYAGFVAGAALAGGASSPPAWRLAAVLGASASIYWLGMAANDVFDRKRDAARAPGRPIPSGRASLRGAAILCAALGGAALLLGIQLGIGIAAASLIGLVLAYDAGGKDVPLAGNLIMGLCRSGNLLLGAAAAMGAEAALSQAQILLGAGALGLYVAQVTAVSRLEDAPPDAARLRARALPLLLAPAAAIASRPSWLAGWINAALLAWLLLDALRASTRAAARPAPAEAHGAAVFVRKALGGIYLVDAGLLLWLLEGRASLEAAVPLYGLLAVGWLWKRRWMRAGSPGS